MIRCHRDAMEALIALYVLLDAESYWCWMLSHLGVASFYFSNSHTVNGEYSVASLPLHLTTSWRHISQSP